MVKVLIFGAAGYIGSATALALRRAGHTVWGVSRQSTVAELEQNEVEVIKGDINELKTLTDYIADADCIIDNVLDTTKWTAANSALLQAIEAAPKRNGEKKRYIYTSGCLVYGDQPGKVLSESDVLKTSPALKGRAEFEQTTIKSKEVDGFVLRPGFVYGGKSAELSGWLAPNEKGEWNIVGSPEKSWGWVHIADLADLYVRAVEAPAAQVSGQIFNASDSTRVTFAEAITGFARAAGFKGELGKAPAPKQGFPALMEASTVTSSQKATKVLGWTPKHGPLTDYYTAVYKAWKAHQKK